MPTAPKIAKANFVIERVFERGDVYQIAYIIIGFGEVNLESHKSIGLSKRKLITEFFHVQS